MELVTNLDGFHKAKESALKMIPRDQPIEDCVEFIMVHDCYE